MMGGLLAAVAIFAAVGQTDFGVRAPPASSSAPTGGGGSAKSFSCAVRYVNDGDTFRCSDGTRVRLSAIDAPEMPGSCRPGRACAPGNPHAAKAALERLIGGRTLRCEPGGASYNRVVAWCSAAGRDLSCAMVRAGHAVRLPQFDRAGRMCR